MQAKIPWPAPKSVLNPGSFWVWISDPDNYFQINQKKIQINQNKIQINQKKIQINQTCFESMIEIILHNLIM